MVRTHASITLGRERASLELGGLRLLEANHAPEVELEPHAHDRTNVTLVLAGGFLERSGGRGVQAGPTSLLIKPRGSVHANRYGPAETRSLVIELDRAREVELGLDRLEDVRWLHGGAAVGELLDLLVGLRDRHDDLERSALACVRALVERFLRQPPGRRPIAARTAGALRRAEGLLAAQVERPPSSVELAARVGLHPVYLARIFRATHGCSLAAYRRRLQVRRAARALAETDRTAAQIALGVGFADQSHLCRAFKAEFGVSPGRYRRLLR